MLSRSSIARWLSSLKVSLNLVRVSWAFRWVTFSWHVGLPINCTVVPEGFRYSVGVVSVQPNVVTCEYVSHASSVKWIKWNCAACCHDAWARFVALHPSMLADFFFLVLWMECSFYNLIMIYATLLFNYSLSAHLFSRPRQNQGLLYKHLHHSLIKWLSQFLWKISSRRRHAQTVKDSASSRKINYSDKKNLILNLKGHQKLRWFCWIGGILPIGGVALRRVCACRQHSRILSVSISPLLFRLQNWG